jgi:hypothetical protein
MSKFCIINKYNFSLLQKETDMFLPIFEEAQLFDSEDSAQRSIDDNYVNIAAPVDSERIKDLIEHRRDLLNKELLRSAIIAIPFLIICVIINFFQVNIIESTVIVFMMSLSCGLLFFWRGYLIVNIWIQQKNIKQLVNELLPKKRLTEKIYSKVKWVLLASVFLILLGSFQQFPFLKNSLYINNVEYEKITKNAQDKKINIDKYLSDKKISIEEFNEIQTLLNN